MSNILLVDDTPDVRTTLGGMLSEAGHSVQTADSESEALKAISQADFQFALIDVRLHDGGEEDESGLTLAMLLHGLKPDLRVMLLTRFVVPGRQIVRAVRSAGIVDFFDKGDPDCATQILDTITSTPGDAKSLAWNGTTHLSLALADGQHTYARTAGQYVLSTRSSRQLQLKVARYAVRTDNSLRDLERFRVDAAALGDELWREVIEDHPEIKEIYSESVLGDQRLTLLFETPRELLQLPLEFMRSKRPPEYLVLQHPVARLILDTVPKRPTISPVLLATTNPIKRLNMLLIASDTGYIPGVESEVQTLVSFIKRNYPWISTRVLATEEATYTVVQRALSSTEYDIIHYAGHGSYDSQSPEESSLFFWSERNQQGTVVALTAAEMKLLLSQSHARLVYLSCCQGTQSGSESNLVRDDFLGLADAVVQAGIPTVIGYRCPVRDDSAPKFAQAFYESLFENGRPEVALWRARVKLATNRNDPTWLSPILIHQA